MAKLDPEDIFCNGNFAITSFGHYRGNSLTQRMLIAAFYQFSSRSLPGVSNKVGSLGLAEQSTFISCTEKAVWSIPVYKK